MSIQGVIAVPAVSLERRLGAEAAGTALLVAAVVGSGIMGERLAGGNAAVALLGNTLATAGALYALISIFGPISGAHFNPIVTVAEAVHDRRSWRDVGPYACAQILGAIGGAILANAMFGLPLVSWSRHVRAGFAVDLSEAVATGGLLLVILLGVRFHRDRMPQLVAGYITAGYWFTASTSFANPAVAVARAFSDTFAGIRPLDVAPFVLAEFAGAALALVFVRWILFPTSQNDRNV